MGTLTVLSEDTNIIPYLNRNGLYPSRVVYNSYEILEDLAFAGEDSIYLVIIHGFTRFSISEIMYTFAELKDVLDIGAQVMVMSDVPLKAPDLVNSGIEYVFYEGDLFFGTYSWYNRKFKVVRNTVAEDKKNSDILNYRLPEGSKNKTYREDYWAQFKEFTTPIQTLEGNKPEYHEAARTADDRYIDTLITVDLYANSESNT